MGEADASTSLNLALPQAAPAKTSPTRQALNPVATYRKTLFAIRGDAQRLTSRAAEGGRVEGNVRAICDHAAGLSSSGTQHGLALDHGRTVRSACNASL